MGTDVPAGWVRIRYPTEFRLSVEKFAEQAGWRVKGKRPDLVVSLQETYDRSQLSVFKLVRLDAGKHGEWQRLSRLMSQDPYQSSEMRGRVEGLREVAEPSRPEDPWVAFRLRFTTKPDDEVAAYSEQQFRDIAAATNGASAWLVEFDPVLKWRLGAARVLFAASLRRPPSEPSEDRVTMFPGAMRLMRSQQLGFASFIEPVLMALAPWLIGISSYRVGGSIVVLFGEALAGMQPNVQAPELINLFRAHSYLESTPLGRQPAADPGDFQAALGWWIRGLNRVFAQALDVTRYRDREGRFVPAAQIGVLMSLERLFISLQTLLAHSGRDDFVRSTMSFDVLDILEGLGFDTWRRMLTLRNAESALQELRHAVPLRAQSVLLPRCSEAVEALRSALDHFVPESIHDGLVEVESKRGLERLAPDRAFADYLRLLRNASHSYRQHAQDAREMSLLASHDGEVSNRLADLALLHVLRFLADPVLPV